MLSSSTVGGYGTVADANAFRTKELGYFPDSATVRAPVWGIVRNGKLHTVEKLYTSAGLLRQATGSWGQVVPAGKP